jgi:hypothetical protein
MPSPKEIIDIAYKKAADNINSPIVSDADILGKVDFVCRNIQNRAGVRLLLACLLAKVHKPSIDIRKPYTAIGSNDCYSGRTYDEAYVESFILERGLPCNPTTAFLTPALRNRNIVLTPDVNLVGRPPKMYQAVLELITDVQINKVPAEDILAEVIRCLLAVKAERQQRIDSLLAALRSTEENIPLSAEAIITLIEQHLNCRGSSRLPVLIVAAAYEVASDYLKERVLPLKAHTSADLQTKALGDIQITLIDDNDVVTGYEMKTKRVTKNDISNALHKIERSRKRIDNYIFITTETIEESLKEYAKSLYETTGGIEFVILDCIGFLRHFLHLFHRLRMQYLEAYQNLVINEPESSVSQPLKEAFLALRQAAESSE